MAIKKPPRPDARYPIQRNGTAKGTMWANALRRSLAQWDTIHGGPKALRRIADEVVLCALDRNNDHFEFAIKEIGARIDGTAKADGINPVEFLHSISDAFTALSDFKARSEVIDGEVVMSDRLILPVEVCVEAGGHGEGVGVSEVPDDSEGS